MKDFITEELRDMKVHEVKRPEGMSFQILRVPGGWIYSINTEILELKNLGYKTVRTNTNSIFVPCLPI